MIDPKNNPGPVPRKLQQEILELAAEICNDQLTEQGAQRLEEVLDGNPAAQQIYNQYMMMHAELYWLEDSILRASAVPQISAVSSAAAGNSRLETFARWAVALAAVLLLGLGLGFHVDNWISSDGQNVAGVTASQLAAPAPVVPAEQVAKVTGSFNCRWKAKQGGNPIGFNTALFAGQHLELAEGVAEITFENGARMILQAPVALYVSDVDESKLRHGRVTTTCPPGAEGFRVITEGLSLVDLGTEFGVLADEEGNTEVHVFNGLVEGYFRESEEGPIQSARWGTDEVIRFDRVKKQISTLAKSSTTFVRTLSSNLGPVSGLFAGEDFDYPIGAIRGQNGGFGWGGAWQDLSAAYGTPRHNAVEAGSLQYGILASSGNRLALQRQFNRVRRILSTSFGGVFDTAGFIEEQDGVRLIGREGTELYISFAQKIDKSDEVFYGFELNRGDGNRNRVLCVGHGAARRWTEGIVRAPDKSAGVTGWAVTSEFNGSNNSLVEFGELGTESTDVTLFVLKIKFGPENKDTVEVFKNPKSLWDEEQCTPLVVGNGNFAFDRISLANFEGHKTFEVDQIRIGDSFSAVTRPIWQHTPVATRSDSEVE